MQILNGMRNSIVAALIVANMSPQAFAENPRRAENAPASLEVTSSAFANGQAIPSELTCEGSEPGPPPLAWSTVPAATKSIAILVEDPDAPNGPFTHWLVKNIPPKTTSITGKLPPGADAARNDGGTTGYTPPCPPSGRHRYEFRVYALDIAFHNTMTRAEFLRATRGHVLAMGQLTGTYQKTAIP